MNIPLPPILLLLAAPLSAQTVGGGFDHLVDVAGNSTNTGFGAGVSGAGDVNADGFDDFAVSQRLGLNPGVVRIFSGVNGDLLHEFIAPNLTHRFGWSMSDTGDVNLDGFDDLIVGESDADSGSLLYAGKAYLYSGQDGSILYEWSGRNQGDSLGRLVSGAGDLNQDGHPDLLVSTNDTTAGNAGNGLVLAYSGSDGSLLFEFERPNIFGQFGKSISDAGDVNHDGFPDVVVGSDTIDFGGQRKNGHVALLSGLDGTIIHEWHGTEAEAFLGCSVDGLGDINQDGHSDILVGAWGAYNGGRRPGKAYAISGADGSVIHEWVGIKGWKSFGWSVSNAGDIDLDGVNDAIIGDYLGALPSAFFIYSGADGSLIHTQTGSETYYDEFAAMVADAGDTNGDGRPDIVVSSYLSSDFGFSNGGAAHVIGYSPFMNASGSEISISAGGRIDFEFDFPAEVAHHDYKVLASTSGNGPTFIGVDVPLTYDAVMQKAWDGSYFGTVEGRWHGTLNERAQGSAVIQVQPGVRPYLIGVSLQVAVVAVHPNGPALYSSTAVPLTFLP